MPKTVEESLLGDHSDPWMDSDCPEAKRLKVCNTGSQQYQDLLHHFKLTPEFILPNVSMNPG